MSEFLQIALSFPTVAFSAILLVAGAYWLLVILGAVDLDLLNLEVDAQIDLEVDFELEADVDADAGVEVGGAGVWAALAGALGLGTVPVTVVLSFWALSAWLLSFAAVFYLEPLLGGVSAPAALVFGLGSFALAAAPTMLIMRPFIHFFREREEPLGGEALIGSVCQIQTSRVDLNFGQAKLADGGAGLLLAVRCADPNNGLGLGSRALIIDYELGKNTYLIEPYDSLLKNSDGPGEQHAVVFEELAAQELESSAERAPEPARKTSST